MKKIFTILTFLCWCILPNMAQQGDSDAKVITILTVNDMHSAIDMFPRFAGIVDSIRSEHPGLLLFSGGDNRTGNPVNDRYMEPGWPMIHLMNLVGFDATAVGNHEFDNNIAGFRNLIGKSNFRYLCANMEMHDSLRLHVTPYRFFEREGIRIGVLGLIQTGPAGIPDSHPNNIGGIRFQPAEEAVQHYRWMREQCDILILLTHCGYRKDLELAAIFPEADIIIGGHSHTVISDRVLRNGVLLAQSGRELRYVTELTVEVSGGRVTGKKLNVIDTRATTQLNAEIQEVVDGYNDSPIRSTVLATVVTPFENAGELGAMLADAQRDVTQTDITLQNYGGVRYQTHPVGDFTIQDAFTLDPFNNEILVFELSGAEVGPLIISTIEIGEYPYVSGITYEYTKGVIKVLLPDGKPIDNKKIYRIAINSYLAAVCPFLQDKPSVNAGINATDALIDYLKKQQKVDYNGVKRSTIVR